MLDIMIHFLSAKSVSFHCHIIKDVNTQKETCHPLWLSSNSSSPVFPRSPSNLLSPQPVPKYNPPGLGEGQSLQNSPGETHISGELVRQFLSRSVKLPRLSRLLSLSSLCLLLWSRLVTLGVFCSCWERCSILLYTWSNGTKKKRKEMG